MTNKTILYLHGLGGSPENKAIEQLKDEYNVIAPKLNYFKKTTWDLVNNMVENTKIDVIIGFSLGGYMAYYLSNKHQIPAILFNPAFKPKYANLILVPVDIKEMPTYGQQMAIIGKKDDVVEPAYQLEMLKDGNIKMEDIGHDVPNDMLYSYVKEFINDMNVKQEESVRKSVRRIFSEHFVGSGPIQEGWKQNLATGLALTAGSFGALKGQDQTHNQNFSKAHQTTINSNADSKDFYSAILGYLDQHGEDLVNNSDDKLKTIMLKKEVMNFCEGKRDGAEMKKLSREGFYFFNQVANLTKDSGNIQSLIQIGQNIKH